MLVMDDLGAHSTSPWAQEKLYQIINYRYNAQLPMVVTTNLSLDELERTEPRIASRLADTRFSVVLGIDATDFRIDRPPSTRYQRSPTSDW
jgi:DNA replication protein DnaC